QEHRQARDRDFSDSGGRPQNVHRRYRLKDARTIEFEVGEYDHDLPLVIDPVLSYSTYCGGNGGDVALAVKVDKTGTNGFVYIAGETLSTQFPFPVPPGAFQPTFRGGSINGDAFIAKLGNTATNLVYLTYLGGTVNDGALD